jgi:hypothetical protein
MSGDNAADAAKKAIQQNPGRTAGAAASVGVGGAAATKPEETRQAIASASGSSSTTAAEPGTLTMVADLLTSNIELAAILLLIFAIVAIATMTVDE